VDSKRLSNETARHKPEGEASTDNTVQLDPQKVKAGFWLNDSTYVQAEDAKINKERLSLRNFIILTVHGQKATGAFFQGTFQVPIKEAEKL